MLKNLASALLAVFVLATVLGGATGLHRVRTAEALTNCSVADLSIDGEEQAFLGLINQYRAENGRAALSMSAALNQAASWMGYDLMSTGNWSHVDSLGRQFWTRFADCEVPQGDWSENLGRGYVTAQDIFAGWLSSPDHNANMLGTTYRFIGISRVAGGPHGWHWVSTFSSTGTPMGGGGGLPAPSNVSVSGATADTLNVFFNDNATTETGFDYERKTGVNGGWGIVMSGNALAGAQAGWYWPNSGLAPGTTYCYRLRAKSGATFSSYSNEACGTTLGNSLGAPSNATVAGATSSSLDLYFNDNATNETGIDYERKTGTGGQWAVVFSGGALPGAQAGWYWPNSGLAPSTTYCYRLRAKNGGTFSAYSNEACGTTLGNPLGAPSNATVAGATSSSLDLYFNDNATSETGIDYERKTGTGGQWAVVFSGNALPGAQAGWYWPNSGLASGTTYCYRLRAKNGGTFSAYSNEACGTTLGNSLPAPSNVFTANPTRTSLNVFFNDNATNETGLEVERRVGSNGNWSVVKAMGALPGAQAGWYWPDEGLSPNTNYCYRMRARNGSTYSAYSVIGCGRTSS